MSNLEAVFGIIVIIIILFFEFIPYFVFVICVKLIIDAIRRSKSKNYFKNNVINNYDDDNCMNSSTKGKNHEYVDVTKDKLEIFNTDDLNSLKDYFYDIFLKFEIAYNNLDYNVMKMVSTKQLFQKYYTGISLDLKVGTKRIINDIQRKKVIIYEIDSTIAKQTASAMIEISYINYTLNNKGYVISGNREKPQTEKFEVTFRKDFEKNDVVKCPNCGANITGNKCEYCRTTIKNVEFKISSIKRIIE